MKILQILCHPDYDNNNRIANLLANLGEKELHISIVREKHNSICLIMMVRS